MSDIYKMLERARAIIEDGESDRYWIRDFKSLPGIELTDLELLVLLDPEIRNKDNDHIVNRLISHGYLMKISRVINSRPIKSVRRTSKGTEALKIRYLTILDIKEREGVRLRFKNLNGEEILQALRKRY